MPALLSKFVRLVVEVGSANLSTSAIKLESNGELKDRNTEELKEEKSHEENSVKEDEF